MFDVSPINSFICGNASFSNTGSLLTSLIKILVSNLLNRKQQTVIAFLSLSSDSIFTGIINVVSVRLCLVI